jgi:D-alanyl-D-alanine carboxypeptidase (penicillin-binding protein 5/6)
MSRSRLARLRVASTIALLALVCTAPAALFAAPVGQSVVEPEIGARAAIVVEYPSGRILYSHAMHDNLAPASTTKLMTAILALEHGNLEAQVTVSPDDLVGESSMGLENGERQSIHNLLYGMLLPSGNDAAMAVARHIGSLDPGPNSGVKDPVSRFVDMMNARASQLGLTDSHFFNPHGLDADGHHSSAYDLSSLAWYALHFPVFNDIVKTPFFNAGGHSLRNTNEMLTRYPGSDGVKTGWTDAGGLCLVTSATRDGHRLISVVLNAPHWYNDSSALLDYGFAKLAAVPQDASAEVLSVARRGTASWLLASASPAAIPTAPALPPLSTLAQGGGTAPQSRSGNTSGTSSAPVGGSAANAGSNGASTAHLGAITRTTAPPSLAWLAGALALLVLAAGLLTLVRNRVFAPANLRLGTASAPAEPASISGVTAPPRPQRGGGPATVKTLGQPPVARRREPNLLLSPEQVARQHILRGVSLAAEGRQGSSMSEFLLALRLGYSPDAAILDQAVDMTAAAFLALSRAQSAAGYAEAAGETLVYAVSALPNDRLLKLSLYQLSTQARTRANNQ